MHSSSFLLTASLALLASLGPTCALATADPHQQIAQGNAHENEERGILGSLGGEINSIVHHAESKVKHARPTPVKHVHHDAIKQHKKPAKKPLGNPLGAVSSLVHHAAPVASALPSATKKPLVHGIVSHVASDVHTVASDVVHKHKGPVNTIVSNVVHSVATPLVSKVHTDVSGVMSHVKSVATPLVSKVHTDVSGVMSHVKSVATPVVSDVHTVVSGVHTKVSGVMSTVKSVATPLVSGVRTEVSGVVSHVKSVATPVVSDVRTEVSGVMSHVKSVATPVVSGVRSDVSGVMSHVKSVATPVVSGVRSDVSGVMSHVKSMATPLVSHVTSAVHSMVTGVNSDVHSMVSGVHTVASEIIHHQHKPVKSLVSGVLSDVSSMMSSITSDLPLHSTETRHPLSGILTPTNLLPSGLLPTATGSTRHPHSAVTMSTSSAPLTTSSTSSTGRRVGSTAPSTAAATSSSSATVAKSAAVSTSKISSVSESAKVTIAPIGTHSGPIRSTASSLQIQLSRTHSEVATDTKHHGTSLPSSMPQLIQPPGRVHKQPANMSIIQLGFKYGLNYPFVANTPGSANQIFYYLPRGISWGLGLNEHDLVMHSLQPYNTVKELGYVTTLALMYIPAKKVDKLQLDIRTAVSRLYQNPDDPTNALMNMINPAISILGGSLGSSNGGLGPAGQNTIPDGGQAGEDDPMGKNNNKKIQGTSVGIGMGVVAGAAVYGAAMFYVARRYKRRRSQHKRASSVMDAASRHSSQHYGSMIGNGALMSGPRANSVFGYEALNVRDSRGSDGTDSSGSTGSSGSIPTSVREAGISAPLMAENSLGWH